MKNPEGPQQPNPSPDSAKPMPTADTLKDFFVVLRPLLERTQHLATTLGVIEGMRRYEFGAAAVAPLLGVKDMTAPHGSSFMGGYGSALIIECPDGSIDEQPAGLHGLSAVITIKHPYDEKREHRVEIYFVTITGEIFYTEKFPVDRLMRSVDAPETHRADDTTRYIGQTNPELRIPADDDQVKRLTGILEKLPKTS